MNDVWVCWKGNIMKTAKFHLGVTSVKLFGEFPIAANISYESKRKDNTKSAKTCRRVRRDLCYRSTNRH